ncbi:MAG: hypothetical protein UX29_C0011G0011 [Parcubacteria group bacterium GW2011_GWA2_46_10]|nr:MAG: hypothetical protein UW86_C0012G0014 [Microgenomates group bacterium GW2011_GWA1_Microgenomates_45_10]KKU19052.1 MAG: hypothetical protein UX29_C0011G0011 [Parcubacteria group bacterium GW2011_GWA2_46_10]
MGWYNRKREEEDSSTEDEGLMTPSRSTHLGVVSKLPYRNRHRRANTGQLHNRAFTVYSLTRMESKGSNTFKNYDNIEKYEKQTKESPLLGNSYIGSRWYRRRAYLLLKPTSASR